MVLENEELFEAICRGDRDTVEALVGQAVERGDDVIALLNGSMVPAMRHIGEEFSRGEVFVPELVIAARAMTGGMEVMRPVLVQAGHRPLPRVAIGTVKGDLHDIGKNLVAMMLQSAGHAVDDLGIDCDVERFARAVDQGASVICLSALLTTSMPYMRTVARQFASDPKVKVVIGGAPVTQAHADEFGADGFARDASEAVVVVGGLCVG